jgi:hypothetical protein
MAHVKISSQAGPNQTPEGETRVVAAQSHPLFSIVAALRGRTSFTERPKQGASHDFCAAWTGIRRQYCRFWAGPNGKRQGYVRRKASAATGDYTPSSMVSRDERLLSSIPEMRRFGCYSGPTEGQGCSGRTENVSNPESIKASPVFGRAYGIRLSCLAGKKHQNFHWFRSTFFPLCGVLITSASPASKRDCLPPSVSITTLPERM